MVQTGPEAPSRRRVRTVSVVVVVLFAFVVLSVVLRIVEDVPNSRDATIPSDDFAKRYVAHPWLANLHLGPGVVYLLGAPLQLSRRFRTRHYNVHRRVGRVLLTRALVSAVFALLFGILFAWGGTLESMATVVFGTWFITCLLLAFRAIKSDNVPQHRRWMIRAFAVAIGIGTIRIWIGVFEAIGQSMSGGTTTASPDPTMFGVAFWLGFSMHVAFGEWWLRRTPALNG
ncbi:MAG: DUF2306 domain-containing protein [Aeromicrobium sp.]